MAKPAHGLAANSDWDRDAALTTARILLEIEASQGSEVFTFARSAFDGARVHLYQDWAGRDRLIEIAV